MIFKRLFCKHNLLTFQCAYRGPAIKENGVKKIPVVYQYKCNKCGRIIKRSTLIEEE